MKGTRVECISSMKLKAKVWTLFASHYNLSIVIKNKWDIKLFSITTFLVKISYN